MDPSAYVKRSAVIGVLKLCFGRDSDGEKQLDQKFIKSIRANLSASDPQLFITSLLVLNELEDGLIINRKLMVQLFNK